MIRYLIATVSILGLAACSGGSGESMAEYDMAEEASVQKIEMVGAEGEAADAAADAAQPGGEIPISMPQIAYSYQYGYRLRATDIPDAQRAHVTLCEQRGATVCRVLNMENSGGEGDYATGMLHLEVAAQQARAFGGQLAEAADEYGGDQIAASISGEDLSKQIVDTEARLRSRELLSQRLTELLRTKSGSVKELVEAERAVT